MEFAIIKKESEINRIRNELKKEFGSKNPKDAILASHSIKGTIISFPRLFEKIPNSKHEQQFGDYYYFLKSKNDFIKNMMQPTEYFFNVSFAISEKLFSLQTSLNNINKIYDELLPLYQEKQILNSQTQRPYIRTEKQVPLLKREISIFLFDSRSILDTITTLFHFLYGPKSKQFRSFSEFVKMCEKDSSKTKFYDSEMRNYILTNCE